MRLLRGAIGAALLLIYLMLAPSAFGAFPRSNGPTVFPPQHSVQSSAQARPVARVISVSTPKGFTAANARLGSFTAAGDLWIVARLPKHPTTSLAEVDPRTGHLLASVSLPVVLSSALTLGPDGNTWFAGGIPGSDKSTVGYVTAGGRVRSFSARLSNDGAAIVSLVAGPGGLIWFNAFDQSGNTWIGHVSRTGSVHIIRYSRFTFEWTGALIATPANTLYTTGEMNTLGIPLSAGRPTTVATVLAEASAVGGNVLAWDGFALPALVTPQGSVTDYHWLDRGAVPADPVPGALFEAGDGSVWFSAADATTSQQSRMTFYAKPVLGQITAQGTVTTWPAAFVGPDGGPVGDDLAGNQDALQPGPDGRLWAIGYDAYVNGVEPWRLYAVTLPDAPVMRAATAQINLASGSGRTVHASLACTGQPGRPCAGQITVTQNAQVVARQPYAIDPGYTQTYTLIASVHVRNDSRLEVSTRDPETGSITTVVTAVS